MQNTHTASSPLFLSAWPVKEMLVEKGQSVRLWEKGQVVPNAMEQACWLAVVKF
jgi:hypothetical protein